MDLKKSSCEPCCTGNCQQGRQCRNRPQDDDIATTLTGYLLAGMAVTSIGVALVLAWGTLLA